MRENTPPASPFNDDEELVYVGDNIDDVIDHLEALPDNEMEEIDEEGSNIKLFPSFLNDSCIISRRGYAR